MMFEEIIYHSESNTNKRSSFFFFFLFLFLFLFLFFKKLVWNNTREKKTEHMPLESLPPFAIIVGAITAIGGIQYAAHVLPMGKPKAVGLDNFDRLLERRDQRIRERSGLQK